MAMGNITRDELYLSVENDYFSIEDILATQVKISCTTNVDIDGFGFLDPSQESVDLPAGSRLELPVWAVHPMAKKRKGGRSFVTAEAPSKYKKGYRDIVKADPNILDLNKWGPYYYRSGLHVVCFPIKGNENEAIREILIHLFRKRMQRLSLTYSYTTRLHSVMDTTPQYRTGNVLREQFLDNLELRIYKDAQKGAIAFQKWMETPSRPL